MGFFTDRTNKPKRKGGKKFISFGGAYNRKALARGRKKSAAWRIKNF